MKMTEFSSALLKEHYVKLEHPSGLGIYVFPKDLTTTHAMFATHYGSLDNRFSAGEGKMHTVPDGIAHFLEHKLFENPDGSDATEFFARIGVDVNAYTTYDHTAYHFTCTAHLEEALEELLRFVTSPYFTKASVQKEQGIITQEIRYYEDNPWDRCTQSLLSAMYHHHPIKKSILGTVKSIGKITPELLYECHRAFYQPANMLLVVAGNVTPEQVCRVVDRVLPKGSEPIALVRDLPQEPPHTVRSYVETEMPVAKPIFNIGIKDPWVPADPEARLRRDTAYTLLDEILFSRAGAFYNDLFEGGVITPAFSSGYSSAEGFGFHSIAGESDTPELVLEKLKQYLSELAQKGLSAEDVERCRRVLYSDELRAYDSTDEIAGRLLSFSFDGVEMFSYLSVLQSITKEELEARLGEMLGEEYFVLSVVRAPKGTTERNDKE